MGHIRGDEREYTMAFNSPMEKWCKQSKYVQYEYSFMALDIKKLTTES